jgi:hypothetical protein
LHAEQRRPADGGYLPGGGGHRSAFLHHAFRRHAGKQRRRRRTFEGSRYTEDRHGGKNLREAQPSGEGAPRQERCRQCLYELADLRYSLPIVTVGDVSGGEDQQGAGDELHRSHHA